MYHCTASSPARYAHAEGFAQVRRGAHSRAPLPHTPSCLALEPCHKDQKKKHENGAPEECSTINMLLPMQRGCLKYLRVHRCLQYEICTIHIAMHIPLQRKPKSPTPDSGTCNQTQSHKPLGSKHSNLGTCHGKQACYHAHIFNGLWYLSCCGAMICSTWRRRQRALHLPCKSFSTAIMPCKAMK